MIAAIYAYKSTDQNPADEETSVARRNTLRGERCDRHVGRHLPGLSRQIAYLHGLLDRHPVRAILRSVLVGHLTVTPEPDEHVL